MDVKIDVGQVWRKLGPYDWVRIERIIVPGYPGYDGGLPGVSITSFSPQLKGIQLKGGKRYFVSDSSTMTWQEQITHDLFLLSGGWKRGDNSNDL